MAEEGVAETTIEGGRESNFVCFSQPPDNMVIRQYAFWKNLFCNMLLSENDITLNI